MAIPTNHFWFSESKYLKSYSSFKKSSCNFDHFPLINEHLVAIANQPERHIYYNICIICVYIFRQNWAEFSVCGGGFTGRDLKSGGWGTIIFSVKIC